MTIEHEKTIKKLFAQTSQRKDCSGYHNPEIAARQAEINRITWDFYKNIASSRPVTPSVLDLCCGPAGLQAITKKGPFPARYTGVDIAIRPLREKNNHNVIVASALQLPFASEQFDAVFAIMALHSLYNLPTAIKEAVRVIKPGGHLIIAENGLRMWNLSLMLHCLKEEGLISPAKGFLRKKQIRDSAGFLARSGITPHSYLNVVPLFLGVDVNSLPEIIASHQGNYWQLFQKIQKLHFRNLSSIIKSAGLGITGIGKIAVFKYNQEYKVNPMGRSTETSLANAYENDSPRDRLKGEKSKNGHGPKSYFPVILGTFLKI